MIRFFLKKLDTQSRTLFKNSSWVFFSNIIGILIAFIKSIFIARGLGAELYGIFTIIIVFVGTLQETINLNLGAAIIKFGSGFKTNNHPEKIVSLLKLSFICSATVAFISVIAIALISLFAYQSIILTPGLEWFVILYAIAASSLYFTQISRGALRLYFKFKINSMVQIIMDVVEFIIIVTALFVYPHQLKTFLIAVLIAKFINSMIPNLAAFKELFPYFKEYVHAPVKLIKDQFKSIRNFVIQNSVAKTLQTLIKNGDVLIIAFLTGDAIQVAYYSVGKKIAYAALAATDPLVTSIYPQLCDLYSLGDYKAMKQMLGKLTRISLLPASAFIGIAWVFNEQIMSLVFGEEYIPSGEVFFLLSIAAAVNAIFFWIQPLLQAIELLMMRIYVYVASIVAGLLIAALLVPSYGAYGMGITMISVNLLMPGLFLYFAINKIEKKAAESLH